MKHFALILFFGLVCSFATPAQAATYNLSHTNNQNAVNTVIEIKTATTTGSIAVTFTNPNQATFQTRVQVSRGVNANGTCGPSVFNTTFTVEGEPTFSKRYALTSLIPDTDYCFVLGDWARQVIRTEKFIPPTALFVDDLAIDTSNNSMAKISGKIDVTKHPDYFKNFVIKLFIARAQTDFDTNAASQYTIPPNGIAADGTYSFSINVTPSTTYYIKQTITDPLSGITLTKTTSFNSSKQYVPPNSKEAQDDFEKRSYRLLAPFPGLSTLLDPSLCAEKGLSDTPGEICDINDFLNFALKILIGIAAVFLVFRLVLDGYTYMVTDTPFKKTAAKGGFLGAIGGLLLALSAWLILNTVNPKLVSNDVALQQVSVPVIDYPDAGDDTVDPTFKPGVKLTFAKGSAISAGTVSAVAKLKDGWEIEKFVVYTNNRMGIFLKKGNQVDYSNVIDIASGLNGYSQPGRAVSGDKKTPIGDWKIIDVRYTEGQAQKNGKGSNMGAAFWHLSPMSNGERGIGMHGNKAGTLTGTNGCIRLKNSDILALQPYVKKGIPVIIKQ